jgi:hypothetical protein
MAFFHGAPDGSTPGHDDLGKEIAEQGLRFTKEQWRWVLPWDFRLLFR